MTAKQNKKLDTAIKAKLKLVLDPELGVSILDLGLIYEVIVTLEGVCAITMTLTTIGCPLFAQIQKEIEDRVLEIPEINDVKIDLVFDPPWSVDKMTEEAKIQLGLD
ncbi:MAG: metal-sulfur cluster assembly factor [Minisyncoccota bacterium]